MHKRLVSPTKQNPCIHQHAYTTQGQILLDLNPVHFEDFADWEIIDEFQDVYSYDDDSDVELEPAIKEDRIPTADVALMAK